MTTIITIDSTTDLINIIKNSEKYDGFFYTGTELNPEIRELILLTKQTISKTHVIGFHDSIWNDSEFIDILQDYNIIKEEVIFINKPISEFNTEELILFEDKLKYLKITKSETNDHFTDTNDGFTKTIRPYHEKTTFKEGLSNMFDHKKNRKFG